MLVIIKIINTTVTSILFLILFVYNHKQHKSFIAHSMNSCYVLIKVLIVDNY